LMDMASGNGSPTLARPADTNSASKRYAVTLLISAVSQAIVDGELLKLEENTPNNGRCEDKTITTVKYDPRRACIRSPLRRRHGRLQANWRRVS
jgi:hypothetical protein